jgi:hypothetical protein
MHVPAKGRGRALRTAWSVSRAEVLAYMDVDLSPGLNALRIHEVPVDWVEDGDSRVQIIPTALADLLGLMRLLWDRPSARDYRTLASPRQPTLAP